MTKPQARRGAGLGTFAGVFTPSVLTILGLILFRRLGFVVGEAGLRDTLVILVIAVGIAALTSISLSAIATNLRVKGGGDYYLISRSLGVEFGGAIGIVLYLAQSISVAFYCVGLGEALAELELVPWLREPRWVAAGAVLFLFVFAWAGADVASKLQLLIALVLGAGILSFFVGGLGAVSTERLAANWSGRGETGFWVVFAIFFPAVTGFTQGVSMSGDLRDAGRSLPLGTFLAVGVSTLVYLAAAIVFAGALPASVLVADYESMARVAALPVLVLAGLIAATLSSALTSLLGAPRILQAMAADRVFPPLDAFAAGHGPASNPRRGVLLTLGIALTFVALGGIDFIAPIVSMFFLISYGLLNYATAFEARAQSPSFRPRFRFFHYRASLAGALACLGAMLMIDALATAIAVAFLFGVYQFVDRLARPERWADSRRDHHFQRLRKDLLAVSREIEHPRSWRPRILVFTDSSERRPLLLRFASWIEGHAGMTTAVQLVAGRRDRVARQCAELQTELREQVAELGVDAYPLVVAAPDLESGAQTVLQANGVGPLRANLALLNWLALGDADATRAYARQIRAAAQIGVNVVILDAKGDEWQAMQATPRAERRIDVWWENDPSSRLMLLLAYMMTRSEEWAGVRIRVLTPAEPRTAVWKQSRLEEILEAVRIPAQAETVDAWGPAALIAKSRDASVVMLPVRLRRFVFNDPFGEPVHRMLESLPVVALVLAVEDIDLDADPEEGAEVEAETEG